MVTPDVLRGYIAAGLQCEHLEVDGDGRHFDAVIVSAAFEGKRPVQRHQAVYAVLGGLMPQIHALALHTHTPAEWKADASVPESPRCRGGSKHDPRPA